MACDRAVTQMSTVAASWSSVEDGWGGVALSESRVNPNQVSLIFRLGAYDVVYDDSTAGFPRIGRLTIP